MGSIPVYLIHYREFIILHFGMCIRKRRTCTFVTTMLYLNMVGLLPGAGHPTLILVRFTQGSGEIYP